VLFSFFSISQLSLSYYSEAQTLGVGNEMNSRFIGEWFGKSLGKTTFLSLRFESIIPF
jgi:hypothetical protein